MCDHNTMDTLYMINCVRKGGKTNSAIYQIYISQEKLERCKKKTYYKANCDVFYGLLF